MKMSSTTSLKPKTKILKGKARSWNVKNKTYTVEYDQETNKWSCSCPHFFYRVSKKHGDWVEHSEGCKHIKCSKIVKD